MRDAGEIRALIQKLWTGNAAKDLVSFLPEEREAARKEHDAESGRRYEIAEKMRRLTGIR